MVFDELVVLIQEGLAKAGLASQDLYICVDDGRFTCDAKVQPMIAAPKTQEVNPKPRAEKTAGDRVRALQPKRRDIARALPLCFSPSDMVTAFLPLIAAELDKQDAAEAPKGIFSKPRSRTVVAKDGTRIDVRWSPADGGMMAYWGPDDDRTAAPLDARNQPNPWLHDPSDAEVLAEYERRLRGAPKATGEWATAAPDGTWIEVRRLAHPGGPRWEWIWKRGEVEYCGPRRCGVHIFLDHEPTDAEVLADYARWKSEREAKPEDVRDFQGRKLGAAVATGDLRGAKDGSFEFSKLAGGMCGISGVAGGSYVSEASAEAKPAPADRLWAAAFAHALVIEKMAPDEALAHANRAERAMTSRPVAAERVAVLIEAQLEARSTEVAK